MTRYKAPMMSVALAASGECLKDEEMVESAGEMYLRALRAEREVQRFEIVLSYLEAREVEA